MLIVLSSKEPMMVKVITGFLSDLGHQVLRLGAPGALMQELKKLECAPDLIIIDFSPQIKPDVNILRMVREGCPRSPIVVCADLVGILPANSASACRIYGYLRKPISLAELELLVWRLSKEKSEEGSSEPQEDCPHHSVL